MGGAGVWGAGGSAGGVFRGRCRVRALTARMGQGCCVSAPEWSNTEEWWSGVCGAAPVGCVGCGAGRAARCPPLRRAVVRRTVARQDGRGESVESQRGRALVLGRIRDEPGFPRPPVEPLGRCGPGRRDSGAASVAVLG
ncbi:hypothetical protein GCM10023205_46230 [Yinghuangia aomiensis]|uniref:Uncharacterized protein n=1 Tax=Yinghuangia aomiensis TaxID=676205 RepID=A0ABP9HMK7_9ACTN